ncbi:MAG: RimK family alpha-L-glutamate ligase [Candidatus Bathyarchaeia archaeon]|nr:RimK family alpha-L-glutamate ligase [Candidatus Bathyarchaeota archaeon]
MRFGLLTRDESSWCSMQLLEAMRRFGVGSLILRFPEIIARVGFRPAGSLDGEDLLDLDALIIRPIGRGSLEEIIFRMDLLYRLERLGLLIVNPPKSIERAVDKYFALTLLEEAGLPVPRTVVTESSTRALKAFNELGGDVVIKPIFGSRGIGSTRVSDYDVAERIFRALSFHHEVIYIQEYIEHGFTDIRAFVLGDRVLASMRRVADGWKTNVSQGARPEPLRLEEELEELAVKASKAVGCVVAGVDILEGRGGPWVIEVNSQPGWMGLQRVTDTNIAEEIIKYIISEIKR